MNIFRRQWTEERIHLWQAYREMGQFRWVMTHWVMGWGTTMFLVTSAGYVFSDVNLGDLRARLIMGMIVWPIAGMIAGAAAWANTEHSYAKHVERRVF